jgi:hypothetical protein
VYGKVCRPEEVYSRGHSAITATLLSSQFRFKDLIYIYIYIYIFKNSVA